MAIGTPANQGVSNNALSVHALTVTTLANIAVGDLIVVPFGFGNSSSAPGVTDTAGNTYTIIGPVNFVSGFEKGYIAYSIATSAMSSGGTISLGYTTDSRPVMAACSVSGITTTSPLDVSVNNVASGTSGTQASGSLAQNDEILFSVWMGNNPGTFNHTGTGTWTALTDSGASGNDYIRWSHQIVTASTSISSSPTWTNSVGFGLWIISFKAIAAAAAATSSTLMMMGV